ncbi:hypothetical protein F751_5423 [Auxenochlorella protothecoides]|uniref:Uncharacterized protein n=1 Tax=Auxenochlorella protothecoides TaxID=3075 RepID=A0A087SQ54_AUXPR|nr:hypothetical protein F751_5423 [Auxenochlorella protothecoides]KFM27858.1 hypothetical protein F751_5423 [Auxenochlorella protothecoides]
MVTTRRSSIAFQPAAASGGLLSVEEYESRRDVCTEEEVGSPPSIVTPVTPPTAAPSQVAKRTAANVSAVLLRKVALLEEGAVRAAAGHEAALRALRGELERERTLAAQRADALARLQLAAAVARENVAAQDEIAQARLAGLPNAHSLPAPPLSPATARFKSWLASSPDPVPSGPADEDPAPWLAGVAARRELACLEAQVEQLTAGLTHARGQKAGLEAELAAARRGASHLELLLDAAEGEKEALGEALGEARAEAARLVAAGQALVKAESAIGAAHRAADDEAEWGLGRDGGEVEDVACADADASMCTPPPHRGAAQAGFEEDLRRAVHEKVAALEMLASAEKRMLLLTEEVEAAHAAFDAVMAAKLAESTGQASRRSAALSELDAALAGKRGALDAVAAAAGELEGAERALAQGLGAGWSGSGKVRHAFECRTMV